MHDSDKLHPEDALEAVHVNIIRYCEENTVSCKTLMKREIENYILDAHIQDCSAINIEVKDAFATLSPQQKDYYDYKIGFKKKPANESLLFNSMSDDVIEQLTPGFGKGVSEGAFSSDGRLQYTNVAMNQRCSNMLSEFQEIESNIKKML
ncbi:hypothetical protein [Shewanella sp.]|uniref:hypothetical protein n=1 Tax=Shewanella sp. TaxID=50422 RepID=UPI0025846732|nr:hypothetical protein [Shewanella sp.]MCJ8305111.1 hypothetical protein [Shewanella sp.]